MYSNTSFKMRHRGFTLIELVVVIAVLSILCAVLIPAFLNLIQSANGATLVGIARNLNIAVFSETGNTTKRVCMHDAVKFALDNGCSLEQFAAKGDHTLLWDSQSDLFCVYDGNDFCYPAAENYNKNPRSLFVDRVFYPNYYYWCVYKSAPEKQIFSIYWASDENFNHELNVGFDAGENNNQFTLNCVDCDAVVRTNGQDINVNGGTVYHHGETGTVCIKNATYCEYGKVIAISTESEECKLIACAGSEFGERKSKVSKTVGEGNLNADEKAVFRPEHVCSEFSDWINDGDKHIRYCRECEKTETEAHSGDICECGYTELEPGLYVENELKVSWESMINNEYIKINNGTLYEAQNTNIMRNNYNNKKCMVIIKNENENKITAISGKAFSDFKGLKSVIIPYGVNTLKQDAFNGCVSLESVYLPSTLTTINNKAFLNCSSLKNITIPASVKKIGARAFTGCKNIVIDCSAFSEAPNDWDENWCEGLNSNQIIFKKEDE